MAITLKNYSIAQPFLPSHQKYKKTAKSSFITDIMFLYLGINRFMQFYAAHEYFTKI